jgi:hypothetical protein
LDWAGRGSALGNNGQDREVLMLVCFYTAEWSNWALVIVGVLTIGVIGWQSWETRRAAQASQRSVELQEVLQQQWLQIFGWRIEGRDSLRGDTASLKIVMNIGNPTNVPLRIENVRAKLGDLSYAFTVRNTYGPDEEPFRAEFPVKLNQEQISNYRQYRLVLTVTGAVTYVDAFERTKIQAFGQQCICGPDGFETFSPLQSVAASAEEPRQQPNREF